MSYDPEKYRDKREKVLGIKKRGVGFGTIALIVSFIIIAGLGGVTVPQAVSYMATRHLDDAIFKLESLKEWPDEALGDILIIKGVKTVDSHNHDTRLVVTYDRRSVDPPKIMAVFNRHQLSVSLLNSINHRQHRNTMKQEAEEGETT